MGSSHPQPTHEGLEAQMVTKATWLASGSTGVRTTASCLWSLLKATESHVAPGIGGSPSEGELLEGGKPGHLI